MRKCLGFTKRNLLVYFKDIQTVIFSLLTAIIILALYLLFLKDTFVDAMQGAMQGLTDIVSADDIDMLANAILLSGILGSSTITVSYNCLTTVVKDREHHVDYDISATPIKRWQIILSYFGASVISSFLISLILSAVGVIVLSAQGELYLDAAYCAALAGVDFLGAVSATSIFMLVMLFFDSASASGAFFGILSAAAGFIIGAYIPIRQFSKGVQTFCNLFPGTGVTILYRNVLLNRLLDKMDASIGGLDQGMFVESIKEIFSFDSTVFGKTYGVEEIILYILAAVLVCIAVMVVVYPRIYRRK